MKKRNRVFNEYARSWCARLAPIAFLMVSACCPAGAANEGSKEIAPGWAIIPAESEDVADVLKYYEAGIDHAVHHSGAASAHIVSKGVVPKNQAGVIVQVIKADQYRNKRFDSPGT